MNDLLSNTISMAQILAIALFYAAFKLGWWLGQRKFHVHTEALRLIRHAAQSLELCKTLAGKALGEVTMETHPTKDKGNRIDGEAYVRFPGSNDLQIPAECVHGRNPDDCWVCRH